MAVEYQLRPVYGKQRSRTATGHKIYKVVLVGDYGVGKSSIFRRLRDGTFEESLASTGTDKCTKGFTLESGETVYLDIWDTAGSERYRTITGNYYRLAKAVVLVYDVSSSQSLYSLGLWLQDAQYYVPGAVPILIGNKSDLPPEENEVDAPGAFAASRNIKHHFKISVKEDDGIRQAFETIAMVLNCTLEDSWESLYNDSDPVIKPYGFDASIAVEPLMAHRSSCTGACSKF